MPLITSNEIALLQTEIEPFRSPVDMPLDVGINDPMGVFVGVEQLQMPGGEDEAGDAGTYLSIDEELSLKKYLNMAVAEKAIEKSGFFKID